MPLRLVIRDYLPQGAFTIWPTEMLNSRKLPHEDLSKTPETLKLFSEDGMVPQILGNEEKFISESVMVLQDWGAEGIDINMGCPVTKALRHNYGVALMGDADYAKAVVAMTKKSSQIPVSVKLRAAEQNDFEYLLKFVKGLQDSGADWVTLHPRTAQQKRRGRADWQQIKMLRESVSIPVIGNGDIQCADDVFRMLNETGADLVMAGRALAAKPWIMWQVGERLGCDRPRGVLDSGICPSSPAEEGAEYGKCLKKLFRISLECFGEALAIRKFRFHVRMTMGWLQFGQTLFSGVNQAKTAHEILIFLEQFFDSEQMMSSTTELRD